MPDLRHAVSLIAENDDKGGWKAFDAYHNMALRRLAASGARVALMASNTPHHRFASVVEGIGMPVINMFDEIAKSNAAAGYKNILILGHSAYHALAGLA